MTSLHFFKEENENYVFETKKINFSEIKLDYDFSVDIDRGLQSILIVNLTDQDVIFSMDGEKDYILVPNNSDCIIPFSNKNKSLETDEIYMKYLYTAEHGSLFMEFIYRFEFLQTHRDFNKSKIKMDKKFFQEKKTQKRELNG